VFLIVFDKTVNVVMIFTVFAGQNMSTNDNFTIVREELNKYGGRQKQAGEYRMVVCPFHDDGTPSCGVYLRQDHPTKTFGYHNCLGCGAHGPWNVFAEKTGLRTIKSWNSREHKVEYNNSKDEESLLGDQGLTMSAVYNAMRCPEAQPWPESMEWRGVKGALIAAVGGKAINDERNDGIAVLFPVKIGHKIRGAVKAMFQKKTPTQLGYITMEGEWVKKFGLFPYSYTAKLIRKNDFKFAVLVEGPRDALRLLAAGIPAISVLGANTIGKTKMLYITNLGLDQIYCLPDNDRGGSLLWKNVKQLLPDARRLKLPRERDEDGKLIKMDPFSAPASVIRQIKVLMRDRHGWQKPET